MTVYSINCDLREQASTTCVFAGDSVPSAYWSGWHMDDIKATAAERLSEDSPDPAGRRSQEAGFNWRTKHQGWRAGILSLAVFATDLLLLHDHCAYLCLGT